MISSLGDSGFSVFQAGHCDWQRPHSVQVVKSRMPFQEKSSIAPTPSIGVLVEVVDVVEGDRLAAEVSGLTAPSAVRPSDSRLKQMLNHAVKRCQATPIVMLRAITIIQIIARTILNIAMR